jgi:TonB-dependent SusC/RagA subfamily outer membrane receptor
MTAATNSQGASNTSLLERPAHLVVSGTSIEFALDELQRTSGVSIAYSPTLLPSSRSVSCECRDATVEEAVRTILDGSAFNFVVVGEQLVVRQRVPAGIQLPSTPVPLTSRVAIEPQAPAPLELPRPRREQVVGTITGRVRDAQTGRPVSAAQVYIAALDIGVLTQATGAYVLLNVPPGTHTLEVARIGYRNASALVTAAEAATIVQDFAVEEEALLLDAVVVTGTAGGSQRRSLGNVVSTLDAGDIATSAAVRIEQAIGNAVPGVRMMAPAGAAGGETSIRIRGSSSLALSGDPLIYVDGIRISTRRAFDGRGSATSRLQDIDPATIESIEIIKGPAAATLYGTEASNGVIQIITKRGVAGDATFEASAEVGANWQPHPERNFGLQWYTDAVTGELTNHNLYVLEQQPDRFGQPFFHNGPIQRYNASIRGGADLFRYYASINRTDEEGFSRGDWTKGWRAQTSLTAVPTPSLSLTVNAARTVRDTRDMGSLMCSYACWATPNAVDSPTRGAGRPYEAQLGGQTDIRGATRFSWSAEVSHQPTSWLTHRLIGGIDNSAIRRISFTPKGANGYEQFWGTNGREGVRQIWEVETPTRTLDYSATVSLSLSDQLTSRTSWGLQWSSREENQVFASGRNFAVSALGTVGAAAERESSESFVENVTLGTFVQNEFAWNNRLYFTAALRFDDNSAFGTDFDAAIYPKVSASWVVSEESFFPEDAFGLDVSQLRLRGAWGESGQQPDAFAAQRLYEPETGPDGQPILTRVAYGNPNLGPEKGSEIELGFDAAMLRDRVSLGFTWYRRATKDAIVARPVRPSEGFPGTQFLNLGKTSSWGTESELGIQLLTNDPLRWDLTLGLTTMGNRIDDMGGIPDIPVVALSGMPSRGQFHVEGFPIAGVFEKRVMSAEFVSGSSGAVTNILCDGGRGRGGLERGGPAVPCDEAPAVFWGGVDPTWQVHLGSSWTIAERWRLNATVDAQAGNVMIADYLAGQNTRFSEVFVKQNDPIFQANSLFARAADVIHDAGFARLREVSLSYAIPESWIARVGASTASLTGSMYNVAVLWEEQTHVSSGQRIWDPEMLSPNFEYNGIATGSPPPMSHMTVRLNVSF